MKKCINFACNAELEGYEERCSYCGRLQKQLILEKKVEYQSFKKHESVGRHGFITFWLWWSITVNILLAIVGFFPRTVWGFSLPDSFVTLCIVSSFLNITVAIGDYMLLLGNRIGLTIIVAVAVIGTFIDATFISTTVFGSYTFFYVLVRIIGICLLVGILHIKKNGISYWDSMSK